MANMPGGSYGSRGKPDHDIYTALIIIACCVIGLAIGFGMFKASELLGHPFPSFAL